MALLVSEEFARVQPHRASSFHRRQKLIHNARDDENFLFGDTEQVIVVSPTLNDAYAPRDRDRRLSFDNDWRISGSSDHGNACSIASAAFATAGPPVTQIIFTPRCLKTHQRFRVSVRRSG